MHVEDTIIKSFYCIEALSLSLVLLSFGTAILPLQGYDDDTAAGMIPVLTQVDTLPGASIQTAAIDGNRNVRSYGDVLDMCRHVIGTLKHMLVVACIFRDIGIKVAFYIQPDIRVSILVDAQRGGCMLDEQVAQADGDRSQFG